MAADTIHSSSGFVIIGDIARFSVRVGDVQEELVLHLWKFLNNSPLLADGSGNQAILNGTGDGALVAFPRNADPGRNKGRVIHWREAVNFSREWAEWMSQKLEHECAMPRLRIGIHQGPFQIVAVNKLGGLATHGGFQIVGKTPNDCARLSSFGDAGDVVLSTQFVEEWFRTSRIEDGIIFDPPLGEPATQAFVKHGDTVSIRRLYRPGPVPAKLASIRIIRDHLGASLGEVERLFLEYLNRELGNHPASGRPKSMTRDELSARVSVWTVDQDDTHLKCSDVRWHYKERSVGPSRIRYPIEGNGAGVPGRAFRSPEGKPVVVTNLPEVDKTRPETLRKYCRALERETGLRPDVTGNFSCYSRSFVAFCVGLHKNSIDAVVCIDAEHPLDVMKKSALGSIASEIQKMSNTPIAALVRLHLA